jgi:poly(A) polymerase
MDDSDPRSKPPCHREDALAVVRALRDAGHVAYFAGGCVRDLLLGLEPKDYDVATDALPQKVRSLFRNTQAVGQAFGVILVRLGRSVVEIATFRTDGKYIDGRHPKEVQFTTAEEDAKRRDFTINGLFFDPIDGRVLDFVGGREDLSNKTLRAIGEPEARFEEDHLRLMRAIRFAARFDLTIERATRKAIVDNAEHLVRISPERIGEELRLMLTAPTRVAAWRHLGDLRLLPVILRFLPETSAWPPNAAPLFSEIAPGQPIGMGLALAAMTLCYRRNSASLPPILSLLTPEEIRRSVPACRKALKISNDESDAMADALDVLPLLRDDSPSVALMKRFLARPHSGDARRLLDAMVKAEPTLTRIIWLRERFAELEKTDVAPPPLVTGDDLTAAGLVPGPLFKRVLDAVYDAQLEGRVRSKEEALEFALRMARQ